MAKLLISKIILSVYLMNQYVSDVVMEPMEAMEPRILYGDFAKIVDYPFYAGLNNCGAAILSNIWILTAAHCVENVNPLQKNYVWVGGETFANSIRVPYNHIYIHQGYQSKGYPRHDIALLKLSYPLQFSKKIQPIKLPSGPITNSNIIFVGRGIDETGHVSKILKKVDLIKLSTKACLKLLPPQYLANFKISIKDLEAMTICAKREGDKPSICKGDSGSPLVFDNSLVGLASFIRNRGCKNVKLGFFVNVPSYVPWIKSITGL